MMRRVKVASVTMLGMALPLWASVASALSLGEIRVASRLNQPLQAEIALVGADDLGEFQLAVTPANKADAQKPIWKSLSYGVKDGQLGKQLVLRSRVPLTEQMTRVTVRITWAGGQLEKLYTLMPDSSASTLPVPVTNTASPAVKRPPVTPTEPVMNEPELAMANEITMAAAVAPTETNYLASDVNIARQYGPTGPRDTLWHVASIHRGNPSKAKVNMDQMQVALYRANPTAFVGSMDKILPKQFLYIPPAADIAKIPRATAKTIVEKRGRGVNKLLASLVRLNPPANWRTTLPQSTAAGFVSMGTPGVITGEAGTGRRISSGNANVPPTSNNAPASTSSNSNPNATQINGNTGASSASNNNASNNTQNNGSKNGGNGSQNAGNNGTTVPTSPLLPEAPVTPREASPVNRQTPWYQNFDWRMLFWPLLFILAGLGFLLLRRRQEKESVTTNESNTTSVVVAAPDGENTAPIGTETNIILPVPPRDTETSIEEKTPAALTDPSLANFVPGKKEPAKEVEGVVDLPTSITHETPVLVETVETPPAPVVETVAVAETPIDTTTAETEIANTPSTDNNTAQLMQEADFHINYGLYDEAARLLGAVLEKEPKYADAQYKRLEALFANQKASEFVPEAARFHADHPMDRRWQKLQLMGQQLAPNEALFQSSARMNPALGVDVDLGQTDADSPNLLSSTTPARFTLNQPVIPADLELPTFDIGQAPSIPQITNLPPSYLSTEKVAMPVPSFPPIGSAAPIAPEPEKTPEVKPQVAVVPSNPTTKNDVLTGHPNPRFNLDIAPVDDLGLLAQFETTHVPATNAVPAPVANTTSANAAVSLPEFNTYLELARSYAALDPRIARELLQDVLERGSELQKNQAQDILGQL